MTKYFDEMEKGKEVVIIASDPNCESAIFHIYDNVLWTYSRNMGKFPRIIGKDITRETIEKHFEAMKKEGSYIFVRGVYDNDR